MRFFLLLSVVAPLSPPPPVICQAHVTPKRFFFAFVVPRANHTYVWSLNRYDTDHVQDVDVTSPYDSFRERGGSQRIQAGIALSRRPSEHCVVARYMSRPFSACPLPVQLVTCFAVFPV